MSHALVIFDVDGTLVDSQADITVSMDAGFAAIGRKAPPRSEVLSIVGLTLDKAIAKLAPDLDDKALGTVVEAYKSAYVALHLDGPRQSGAVLYPGATETLEALNARPDIVLGIATGKSRRGLEALLDRHDLRRFFVTTQVADDHPSKPHPAMLETALAEAGVAASEAVMIGDTSYDMEMACAAGVAGLGVTWGYHTRGFLTQSGAVALADEFAQVPDLVSSILSERHA